MPRCPDGSLSALPFHWGVRQSKEGCLLALKPPEMIFFVCGIMFQSESFLDVLWPMSLVELASLVHLLLAFLHELCCFIP